MVLVGLIMLAGMSFGIGYGSAHDSCVKNGCTINVQKVEQNSKLPFTMD